MKKARTSGKQAYMKGDRLVIENKQFTVIELEEREIESEEENSGEKTTKSRDTKETTGSRGQAEGKINSNRILELVRKIWRSTQIQNYQSKNNY
ncbi:hypothetical protein HHI36_018044 [Cryptolaemus montrouzieri]|uniref:Uncharacterized protein n=1 Tax=Cryptolaemus montrouzieri TaxID=559131 RepID=A0ABD2NYV5_9CUCU